VLDPESLSKKIEDLEALMSQASRTEYKKLSEELTALKKERNTYTKGMEVVSSKISKFHERIEKLNDSLLKISLKSPLIG